MVFKKGNIPHNKGKTKEEYEPLNHKKKLSSKKIGRIRKIYLSGFTVFKTAKILKVNETTVLKYVKDIIRKNGFKKGEIPHNKGKTKYNYEPLKKASEKLSISLYKYFDENESKLKGKKHTKEHIINWLESRKNNGKPWVSEETKRKIKMNHNSISGEKHSCYGKFGKEHPTSGYQLKGKNHYNWQDGKSFEPYGIEFNNNLKELIKKRDNYRCQQCFRHQDELFYKNGKKYSLVIHHIDYNKQNNHPENLISLCINCHLQTNFKRKNWINYFQNKIEEINK